MNKRFHNLLTFGYISFLVIWLAGSIFILAKQAFAGKLLVSFHDNLLMFADFVQFYSVGQTAIHNPQRIYDLDVQLAAFNHLIAPAGRTTYFVVQYPPFFFLFVALLPLLPLYLSYFVFCVSSAVIGLFCLNAVLRNTALLSARDCKLFLLAACMFLPSWMTLRMGQLGWLILACFCLYYLCWRKGNDLACGALLALTTLKPQYTMFLAIPAIVCLRWRMLLAATVCEVFLLVAAGVAFGWNNVLNYPAFLSRVEWDTKFVYTEKMVNLRALLALIMPEQSALMLSMGVLAVSAILIGWLWLTAERRKPQLLPWAMALTTLLSLIVNPHVHLYDLMFVCLSAALTLPTVSSLAARQLNPPSLRIWCSLLLSYPIVGCLLFVYWDVFGQWLNSNFDPFTVLNLVLLFSGLSYFRRQAADLPSPSVALGEPG
jgi:hypothetical protein